MKAQPICKHLAMLSLGSWSQVSSLGSEQISALAKAKVLIYLEWEFISLGFDFKTFQVQDALHSFIHSKAFAEFRSEGGTLAGPGHSAANQEDTACCGQSLVFVLVEEEVELAEFVVMVGTDKWWTVPENREVEDGFY